jgi:hypothetical protein
MYMYVCVCVYIYVCVCVCVCVCVYILQNKYGKLSLEITGIIFCVKIWHCIKHQKFCVVKNLQYKENYYYGASTFLLCPGFKCIISCPC